MSVEQLTSIFQGIVQIVTAVGVILIALKVKQVEKQGNSVSLELKRNNMIYAEAAALSDPKWTVIAVEARTAYEEAVKSNARL